jgi:hypothetical protein
MIGVKGGGSNSNIRKEKYCAKHHIANGCKISCSLCGPNSPTTSHSAPNQSPVVQPNNESTASSENVRMLGTMFNFVWTIKIVGLLVIGSMVVVVVVVLTLMTERRNTVPRTTLIVCVKNHAVFVDHILLLQVFALLLNPQLVNLK